MRWLLVSTVGLCVAMFCFVQFGKHRQSTPFILTQNRIEKNSTKVNSTVAIDVEFQRNVGVEPLEQKRNLSEPLAREVTVELHRKKAVEQFAKRRNVSEPLVVVRGVINAKIALRECSVIVVPTRQHVSEMLIGLRVAVLMSGHLRTWDQTWKTHVQKVLTPNDADLYLATYPRVGNSIFNFVIPAPFTAADVTDVSLVLSRYAPHLRGLILADSPSMTANIFARMEVDRAARLSWELLSFMLMEWTMDIAEGLWSSPTDKLRRFFPDDSPPPPPPQYDVYIRMRPDLYVVGSMLRVNGGPNGTFALQFTCNGTTMKRAVNAKEVVLALRHPVNSLLVSNTVTSSSAIGSRVAMARMMRMYSAVIAAVKDFDIALRTLESQWVAHGLRSRLRFCVRPSWYIYLHRAMSPGNPLSILDAPWTIPGDLNSRECDTRDYNLHPRDTLQLLI